MAPTAQSVGPYTAVVTGASGFVASEIVKQLLNKGWNVRGTVRSLSKKDKVQHLQALGEVSSYAGYRLMQRSMSGLNDWISFGVCAYMILAMQAPPGKLTLHEADLLQKGSFDDVVKVGIEQLQTPV